MAKNQINVYSNGKQIKIKVAHNQKVVMVSKVHPKKGKILDIAANKQAMQNLSPHGYILYMHFVLSVPGYIEALSSKNLTSTTSLSDKTYYKAVDELIAKNYLVKTPHKDYKDFYVFYEDARPPSDEWWI